MNENCKSFVQYVTASAPKNNKQRVEEDVVQKFQLVKDRKVYHNDSFAVRFNYSKSSSGSFSNTVLSLSALEKYDRIPFFVVLVRRDADNLILLANTTFLKKISHSSKELSLKNIRGSFNGSDIMREAYGKTNTPENFDFLFTIHQGLDWEDNLSRLVDASSNIQPVNQKFLPSDAERENIFGSIDRAVRFVESENFHVLEDDLNKRCNRVRNEILVASHIENTNIRGRLIESLITSDEAERDRLIKNLHCLETALPAYDTKNGLGDYHRKFDNGDTFTDIKTKVVYLHSNPKAYNVDKFLKQMSDAKSVFLFFFVGVDEKAIFRTLLCSAYHEELIDSTLFQHHWSGRSSRGAAQFNGTTIDEMLNEANFKNNIVVEKAKAFIEELLNR